MSRETKADLINKLANLRVRNKALEETLDKTTDLVVDYQERLSKVIGSRDELLKELKEVQSSGLLPDGDGIDIPTMMWLERLVQRK